MSSRVSTSSAWRWRRAIARASEPLWLERMGAAGEANWLIVERPGRVRLVVEAFFATRSPALALVRKWGGRADRFTPAPPKPEAPLRVNAALEIVHDPAATPGPGRLVIPCGLAFGSGEHATTLMLLRALTRRNDLAEATVLDIGTGSGVLALAARRRGARRIVAADFDPAAIRTARRNEALNFSRGLIRWQVADVQRLGDVRAYSLIMANLYSGLLIGAARRLARALAPGGELWLSGVLRVQQEDVTAAFRRAGLRPVQTVTRGKWIMQRWSKRG